MYNWYAPTSDGSVPAFVAGTGDRAVVVLHESFGVTEYIRRVCGELADAGWIGVAPSLFRRAGSPVFDYDEMAPLDVMGSVTGPSVLDDLDAVLNELGLPAEQVAVLGFCMGGTASFYYATNRTVGAAVSFYGGSIRKQRFAGLPPLIDVAHNLDVPWLGLYGQEDQNIPNEDVDELERRLSAAGASATIRRYAGAGHGFHCNARASYDADAATAAWSAAREFLDRTIEPGS